MCIKLKAVGSQFRYVTIVLTNHNMASVESHGLQDNDDIELTSFFRLTFNTVTRLLH